MNLLLKNLELEIAEGHMLIGEKLLEEGKVNQLLENERHLWMALVDGLEVEMQITPSRVRAGSCECKVFHQEGMCGHLAAGLLALRKKLSDTRSQRPQPKQPRLGYQKLTINAILENVTQAELADFVRAYSRSNKQFSLAFRVRFASKVPMFDDVDKYSQLLDSAISAARKTNDRLSVPGTRQLAQLVSELLHQADDAIALEHFAEAWAVLSAVLQRTSPVIRKADEEPTSLASAVGKALDRLAKMASLKLPPALREDMQGFCREVFARPSYQLNGLSGKLLEVAKQLADGPEALIEILVDINSELAKLNLPTRFQHTLLSAKLDLLQMPSMAEQLSVFTLDCLAEPKLMNEVLDAVEQSGSFSKVKDLIEKGYRLMSDEQTCQRLEGILLLLAQHGGEDELVTAISRQRFLATRDMVFFEKCRAHHNGDWQSFVRGLLADLIARYDYRQNLHTIASILSEEGMHDELLKLLTEQQSLDFTQCFDRFLLPNRASDIQLLYEAILRKYFAEHFGLQASKRLRNLLEHLQDLGMKSMADSLLASVTTAFPNRTFYLEDIEAL